MVHHLHSGDASLVVDTSRGVPEVVWWGAALDTADEATVAAARPPATAGGLDTIAPLALVAEHGSGFMEHPGILGSRGDGSAWAPRFALVAERAGDDRLEIVCRDDVAALELVHEVEATPGGGHRIRASLTNLADADDYRLDELSISVAVPPHAAELITFHGRWCRELHPQRQPFGPGAVVAENRRGRTSHQHPPLVWVGSAGFGEQHGDVWGAHLAWSGNSRVAAERLPDGRCRLQLGELLHPGEVVLRPGDRYTTPWVILACSDRGLTPASRAFHGYVRSLPGHPDGPRPVTLNVWEAVYFDHDLDRLVTLAERAAAVGVERFVLDDGWFGGRRDDTSSLGDWWVSPDAHPHGLGPLIEAVQRWGMTFGLWVEPEMVSPDSELYRAHPDWALTTPGYDPVLGRHQLVLDLARPDAFAEILGRLDAILTDHDIGYVKWDMNRDHVQGSGADARAGTHRQTLAVYRLFDELRRRHPSVEFESCSSGGARIDHGVLERTARVWTSDCNDALERQTIQRWATTFLPPETIGAHVGPTTAHTTGRTHALAFRAVTALFGHFGVEWNLLDATEEERAELATWIALYKQHRSLLHHGDVVRVDDTVTGPHAQAHGVLATDRSEALVAYVQLSTAPSLAPQPLRIPELTADRRYRVTLSTPPSAARWLTREHLPILDGIELSGRQLAAHGVRLPVVPPEAAILLHVVARP